MNNLSFNPLTFPLWWYTQGLGQAWQRLWQRLHWSVRRSGLVLFVRHLREPLYGDYTRSGIIISFFLRLVLLAGKLVWLGIQAVVFILLFMVYMVLLPLLLIAIFYQLFLW
jgi:hypothetical protein